MPLFRLVMNSTVFLLYMRTTLYNILFLDYDPKQRYNLGFLACYSQMHFTKNPLSVLALFD